MYNSKPYNESSLSIVVLHLNVIYYTILSLKHCSWEGNSLHKWYKQEVIAWRKLKVITVSLITWKLTSYSDNVVTSFISSFIVNVNLFCVSLSIHNGIRMKNTRKKNTLI